MARLTWVPRPHSPSTDRGQLLLIGAFGIAVVLLVFAGVLNTVTYTESLGTEGSEYPTSQEVTGFQEDVRSGIDGIMIRVNNETGNYSTKATRFTDSAGNWSDATRKEHVSDVTGANVSVSGTSEGSRITQSSSRTLTNASGTGNWTLAESVPDTRRFTLRLNRSSLVTGSCTNNTCYELVVEDSVNNTWNVSVNQSVVLVEGPDSSGQCAIRDDPVSIDLTGGTVDGRDCAPLTFAEGVSDPYDIRYRNGNDANGTYQLTVNTTVANDTDYAPDGSPSVTPAIYDATVRISYRTPRLAYSNSIRVARGEPDV